MAGYAIYFTAEKNLLYVRREATPRMFHDMLVDDLITWVDNVEEGKKIVSKMKQLLGFTGFKLTKWTSNDTDILQDIDTADLAPAIRDITSNKPFQPEKEQQKTLDLVWDSATDLVYMKKTDFDGENG